MKKALITATTSVRGAISIKGKNAKDSINRYLRDSMDDVTCCSETEASLSIGEAMRLREKTGYLGILLAELNALPDVADSG